MISNSINNDSIQREPLVSIVTVVYNGINHLEKTIISVINQTYKNLEYIIIDGESTDGTIEIIKKYEKKISFWISEKDSGIYNAMNKGIKSAKGEFLCFMNSADTFYNASVVEDIFLNKDYSKADIIFGSTYIYKNNKLYEKKPKKLKTIINGRMIFVHQSSFVRTEVLNQNLFNEEYKVNADYDLFLGLYLRKYHFLSINHPVSIYDNNGFSQHAGFQGLKEKLAIQKSYKIPRWSIYLLFIRYFIAKYFKMILNIPKKQEE